MPRRMVDGNLTRSASLSSVSLEANLVFVLAMTLADDQGRLDGDTLLLRSELFPRRRDVTDEEVEAWVSELVVDGCLHRYTGENGKALLHFPAWETFQRLRKPSDERRDAPESTCEQCQALQVPKGETINFLDSAPLKEEARSEKREARGKSGKAPQVAASRGKPPRKRKDYTVPDALTQEQIDKVIAFTTARYPALVDDVPELVDACLRHNRASDNKNRYVQWVSVCEKWITTHVQFNGGENAKARAKRNVGGGKGVLESIYEEQVART